MSEHKPLMAGSHQVREFEVRCSCGWESGKLPTPGKATLEFAGHMRHVVAAPVTSEASA